MQDIFINLMFNIFKTYINVKIIYSFFFFFERIKVEKVQKIVGNLHDKEEC